MVTAHEVEKLATRLAKAEVLVHDGAIFPVAGLDGYAVVRNGHGTQMYLVRHAADHEHCTCPDFQHRQGTHGQPCKHILAAGLAAGTAPETCEAAPTGGVPPLTGTAATQQPPAENPHADAENQGCSTRSRAATLQPVITPSEAVKRLKGKQSIALLNGDEDEVDRLDKELAVCPSTAS
jgi:hypothetical protein